MAPMLDAISARVRDIPVIVVVVVSTLVCYYYYYTITKRYLHIQSRTDAKLLIGALSR